MFGRVKTEGVGVNSCDKFVSFFLVGGREKDGLFPGRTRGQPEDKPRVGPAGF